MAESPNPDAGDTTCLVCSSDNCNYGGEQNGIADVYEVHVMLTEAMRQAGVASDRLREVIAKIAPTEGMRAAGQALTTMATLQSDLGALAKVVRYHGIDR